MWNNNISSIKYMHKYILFQFFFLTYFYKEKEKHASAFRLIPVQRMPFPDATLSIYLGLAQFGTVAGVAPQAIQNPNLPNRVH